MRWPRGLDRGGLRRLVGKHARAVRPKLQKSAQKVGANPPARQARPLHRAKPVRNEGLGLAGLIDDDGQYERHAGGESPGTLGRQVPLNPEVPLVPSLRRRRDDRDEKDTLLDLAPYLCVPFVAVLQAAVGIKPDFDSARAQAVANALGRLGVLGGVA